MGVQERRSRATSVGVRRLGQEEVGFSENGIREVAFARVQAH